MTGGALSERVGDVWRANFRRRTFWAGVFREVFAYREPVCMVRTLSAGRQAVIREPAEVGSPDRWRQRSWLPRVVSS